MKLTKQYVLLIVIGSAIVLSCGGNAISSDSCLAPSSSLINKNKLEAVIGVRNALKKIVKVYKQIESQMEQKKVVLPVYLDLDKIIVRVVRPSLIYPDDGLREPMAQINWKRRGVRFDCFDRGQIATLNKQKLLKRLNISYSSGKKVHNVFQLDLEKAKFIDEMHSKEESEALESIRKLPERLGLAEIDEIGNMLRYKRYPRVRTFALEKLLYYEIQMSTKRRSWLIFSQSTGELLLGFEDDGKTIIGLEALLRMKECFDEQSLHISEIRASVPASLGGNVPTDIYVVEPLGLISEKEALIKKVGLMSAMSQYFGISYVSNGSVNKDLVVTALKKDVADTLTRALLWLRYWHDQTGVTLAKVGKSFESLNAGQKTALAQMRQWEWTGNWEDFLKVTDYIRSKDDAVRLVMYDCIKRVSSMKVSEWVHLYRDTAVVRVRMNTKGMTPFTEQEKHRLFMRVNALMRMFALTNELYPKDVLPVMENRLLWIVKESMGLLLALRDILDGPEKDDVEQGVWGAFMEHDVKAIPLVLDIKMRKGFEHDPVLVFIYNHYFDAYATNLLKKDPAEAERRLLVLSIDPQAAPHAAEFMINNGLFSILLKVSRNPIFLEHAAKVVVKELEAKGRKSDGVVDNLDVFSVIAAVESCPDSEAAKNAKDLKRKFKLIAKVKGGLRKLRDSKSSAAMIVDFSEYFNILVDEFYFNMQKDPPADTEKILGIMRKWLGEMISSTEVERVAGELAKCYEGMLFESTDLSPSAKGAEKMSVEGSVKTVVAVRECS